MRRFKVINIDSLIEEESKQNEYIGQIISITPILSKHYSVLDTQFRCTEHKKGSMKLINENYLLFLKEIW